MVTGVVPSSPPVLVFSFYRAWGSAVPLLVDFSSSVANSRSRAFRTSICAQTRRSPNEFMLHCRKAKIIIVLIIYTSMHSVGLELTKLTCTRLKDNLIRHRGDRILQQYNNSSVFDASQREGKKKLKCSPRDENEGTYRT